MKKYVKIREDNKMGDEKNCYVGERVMFKQNYEDPEVKEDRVGLIVNNYSNDMYEIVVERRGKFLVKEKDIMGKVFDVTLLVRKDGSKEIYYEKI